MITSYVTLDYLKSRGTGVNISGSTEDLRLRRLVESVTDQISQVTRRYFGSITDTKYFSGNGKTRILLPVEWDIIAVTSLTEDDNDDGSYNNSWGSSDYILWPYDADPTGKLPHSRPYEALEVNLKSPGNEDTFAPGRQRFKLVGRFGFWEWLDTLGTTVSSSGAFESSATQIVLSSPSSAVEIGMTIKIDSEQMYVTDRSSSEITVIRGINGTTESSHAASATIEAYRYPSPIVEATIQQTARLWSRREQGYANRTVINESGQIGPLVTGLDRDVLDQIRPYVKPIA